MKDANFYADAISAQRESDTRFRQLTECLPQLVWTCQPDGPCDYLSPQWLAFTGVPEQAQLGYGWLNQLHPEDRDSTVAKWQETAAQGKIFATEFRLRRHDGQYFWFDTRATPLRDAQGRIIKWFGSNTDITTRKNHEREISRLTRLYATLSQVNQIIVRVNSREELFKSICRLVIEFGKFEYAWIAWQDVAGAPFACMAADKNKNEWRELPPRHHGRLQHQPDRPAHGPVGLQ